MQPSDQISIAAVRRAAQEVGSIQEAETRLGVTDLAALLADPAIGKAWENGRLYRRLGELAGTPLCQEAAAKALDLTQETFQEILSVDTVAREIWRTGRQRVILDAKTSIMAAAQRGEAYAVRAMERLLRTEAGAGATSAKIDFTQLSLEQVSRATGIARQQLFRWRDKHGMPQGGDGRYSLPRVIAWLRAADVGKVRRYRRKPDAVGARILKRVQAIIAEELSRGPGSEPAGHT